MLNNLFKKRLFWLVVIAAIVAVVAIFFSSSQSADFLWKISQNGKWLLPVLTVAALVDSINPCAFSILILTIAFLFSLGKMRSDILKIGGAYILGIFLVYVAIGLGVLQALHFFNTPHFMAKVGAALLIGFGAINLINEFFPSFPIKLGIPQSAHKKMAEFMNMASVPTALILGVFVGLCEFPCTGGPYLLVLGLLHDQATFWPGLGYLTLYNLIFVSPLVIILLIASEKSLLDKVQEWKRSETGNMRFWSGVAMVLVGLLIFAL